LRRQPIAGRGCDATPDTAGPGGGDWRIRFARDSVTRTVNVLRVLFRGRAHRD